MLKETVVNTIMDLGESPSGRNLNVLIVEDHEIVREGLHRLVSRTLGPQLAAVVVHYASSLVEAIEIIRVAPDPLDLIFLDLELEDAHAQDCIACIRDAWVGLPVVVVTANDDWGLAVNLMDAGVLGVIPKKNNVEIIANAIRVIAAGGRYFPDEVLRFRSSPQCLVGGVLDRGGGDESSCRIMGGQSVQGGGDTARDLLTVDHELMNRLSPRQRDVFALMAEGFSNKEIAKMLGLSVGTAKNYVSSILRILGATRRGAAIKIAMMIQARSQ